MTSHLRSFAQGLVLAALVLVCPHTRGQDQELRQFDPSDVYFQAWLKIREAENAEKEEKYLVAFNHYKKAGSLFDTVGVYHPDWKPHLVKDRQATTLGSMDKIRDKALAEQQADDKKLDGMVIEGRGLPTKRPDIGIKPFTPQEDRIVATLQRQIRALETQVKNVTNDRDANAAQLRRTLADLKSQRDKMARAPLEGQVQDLNAKIAKVQQEREAMAAAHSQSRTALQKALAQNTALTAERDAAMNRINVIENNLAVQQKASTQVVRGLRDQLKDMKALAADKDRLLAAANKQNAELSQQVRESNAEIADLREERGELLKERDHMASLLELNETNRVKILIEQNMKLGHDLNDAKERLAQVAADNNRTAQELIDAKSRLAIAKAKIIQLNTDYQDQAERLVALEERLREESKSLTDDVPNDKGNSREEITVLQGIIDRTLKVQTRRRKAQKLLLETVKRNAIKDPEVWGALELLGGQELQLTPEESKLVENRAIDGEFVFGERVAPEDRIKAGNQLQQSIGIKSNLAKRAFSNGRFLVAREFFESILDEHPGHVPTKLNLGVVHLRNQDPTLAIQSFNDALTIRPDIPYAHFMLGVSHYELGDYLQSRQSFQESLKGDPTNAKAHVFIGSIAGVAGEFSNADKHWQKAIGLDPTLSEPYYNLAILRLREGKKTEARKLYRKARESGRQPDFALEGQIGR
ncbi:MAG: tetratricopeptide repeat protein [Akkermansiaceae bacterium]|nr:tetratricopeptide repeat protein [Akkermansiaceae bacterium]